MCELVSLTPVAAGLSVQAGCKRSLPCAASAGTSGPGLPLVVVHSELPAELGLLERMCVLLEDAFGALLQALPPGRLGADTLVHLVLPSAFVDAELDPQLLEEAVAACHPVFEACEWRFVPGDAKFADRLRESVNGEHRVVVVAGINLQLDERNRYLLVAPSRPTAALEAGEAAAIALAPLASVDFRNQRMHAGVG